MNMPLDPETAKRLRDAGQISPDTYAQAYGAGMETEPLPIPDLAAANTEANRIAIDQQRKDIDDRINFAKQAGVPEDQIQAKMGPALADVEKEERLLQLTTDPAPNDGIEIDPRDQMVSPTQTAAFDLQQKAVGMAAQAGMSKAAEQAAYLQQTQQKMQDMQEANEAAALRDQERLAAETAKLDSEVQRVSQLQVDPNRYWAEASTGNKVLAGISLFLGAVGSAQTGVNQAAKIIDTAIDRDINAQKANIANERAGVANKRGLLGEMKSQFKDDSMARNAAKIAYLDNAQLKIKEIASRYEGPEIAAKATGLIGELEAKKQLAQQDFMAKFQASQPIGPDATLQDIPADKRPYWVFGYGEAATKKGAEEANDSVATLNNVKDSINRLLEIQKVNFKSLPGKEKAEAETITSLLIGQLRKPIVGPGAVSENELALLNRIIANPTAFMSYDPNNKKRLETLKDRVQKQTNYKLKSLGLKIPPSEEEKLGLEDL